MEPYQLTMKPYQRRIVEEKDEVNKRATALSDFIGLSSEFNEINPKEQELLKEKCEMMWEYYEFIEKLTTSFNNQR